MISRPDQPATRPLGVFTIVASAVFLLAGIAWPQAAEALLRLFLATLAFGFVSVASGTMLPTKMTHDSNSPFHGPEKREPPPAPRLLRDLTRELGAVDDARHVERTAIPSTVRWSVVAEASRRLAGTHGLNIRDPDHRTAIRSLVSEPTWLLISAARPEVDSRRVPLSRLGLILDDLERL